MVLNFEISEILDIYNSDPGLLRNKVNTVALIPDSTGKLNSILLEKSKNGNYWLLQISLERKQKYFLLPQPDITFNEFQLRYFEKLFTRHGEYTHPRHPFKLDRLAEVKLTSIPDQWTLTKKGEMTFVEDCSHVWLLQAQIEHLQTEISNLSATLNYAQEEAKKLQATIGDKDQTIKDLQQQLTELRKTYENAWQQSLTEQRSARNDRERLQSLLDKIQQKNVDLLRLSNFWEDQYKNLQKQIEGLLPTYQELEAIGKKLINMSENEKIEIKSLTVKKPHNPFLFLENSLISDFQAVEILDDNLFDLEVSNLDPQTIEVLNWYQKYQDNPVFLEKHKQQVSETSESFNARRKDKSVEITLAPAVNHSFLIFGDYYLFPRSDSKITTPKINTVEACFECENFLSGAPFEVLKPAIVFKLSGEDDRWQLKERGKLRFLS